MVLAKGLQRAIVIGSGRNITIQDGNTIPSDHGLLRSTRRPKRQQLASPSLASLHPDRIGITAATCHRGGWSAVDAGWGTSPD